ncbi:MAG: hypothetical protein ACKV2U_06790 [Bryobacteraceae bacterium]
MLRRTLFLPVFGGLLFAQLPPPDRQNPDAPNILRTPDGRNRTEMILKADHEASLKDLDAMRKLIDEVKIDMEKNDRHVLSVATLKKLDEIEKLNKKIRGRMKRF